MNDRYLQALDNGELTYRRKYSRAPGRLGRATAAYDEGVLEGIRWARQKYTEVADE